MQADVASLVTTRITTNSVIDSEPVISDSHVAWTGDDGDREIFPWNGATIDQTSTNSVVDGRPRIDGTKVVWEWNTGLDKVIGFFDGVSTTTLSATTFNNEPSISGSRLVWFGATVPNRKLYTSDDGGTPSLIPDTDSTRNHEDHDSSGSNVVWEGFGG